jgi:hypothetical protein
VGVKSFFSVVVALSAIPTLVFLNRFVILLIFGPWYVNVVSKHVEGNSVTHVVNE